MRRSRKNALCVWFCMAGASTASSDPKDELELFEELPTVITAAQREQKVAEAPSTIEVYDRQFIDETGVRTLGELLRLVPGVDVQLAEGGLRDVVHIRGGGGRGASMLLMVDGVILNHPYTGIAYIDARLPLVQVQQIEVVRGPGSSLYGANATAGIVHVITRGFPEVSEGNLAASYGEFGSTHLDATYSQSRSVTRLSLNHSDGYTGNRISKRDEYESLSIATRVGLSPDITVSGGFTAGEIGISGIASRPLVSTKEQHADGFLSMAYKRDWTKAMSLHSDIYYAHFTSQYFRDDGEELDTDEGRGAANLRIHYDLMPTQSVMVGGEYRTESAESDLGPVSRETTGNVALFVQDELRLADDRIYITAGGRWDHHSVYGSELSPRAAAIYYARPYLSLKATYDRAFRAPTLSNLYIADAISPTVTLKGNEELKPEHIETIDLGIRFQPYATTLLETSVFLTDGSDIIGTVMEGDRDALMGTVVNREGVEIKGVEFGVRHRLREDFKLRFNYTFLDAIDLTNDAQLADVARHKAQAIATATFVSPVQAITTVKGRYVGSRDYVSRRSGQRQRGDDFTVVDLLARVTVVADVHVTLQIRNLTDTDYREFHDVPLRRRTFEIGLEYDF